MHINDALTFATDRLADSPTARGDARLLLQHVLGVERAYLIAHGDEVLSEKQEAVFRELVARAEKREPIPYITGKAPFYGLSFKVTPAVLIPRPETEMLVEAALAWIDSEQARRVVDVGTGSGCIAVTLAVYLDEVALTATDVSPAALAVARENAARHGVEERIEFLRTSLLEDVEEDMDLIVANLPYVSDEEWTSLEDGVKWYEPAGALRGGPQGLDLILDLLQQARSRLRAGGAIFLEIGWRQGPAARDLAQSIFPAAQVTVKPDFAGHDRMVIIETK